MALKPSDIWPNSNSAIPDKEEINRYVDGKMDKTETHQFERKMANSALLNDAVEGLLLARTHEKAIAEIEQRIDNASAEKGKLVSFLNFTNMSIAASVLLVLGGGILFFMFQNNSRKSEMALLETTEKQILADSSRANEPAAAASPPGAIAYAEQETDNTKKSIQLPPDLSKDNYLADNKAEEIQDEKEQNKQAMIPNLTASKPAGQTMGESINPVAEADDLPIEDSLKWREIATQMLAFNDENVQEEQVTLSYASPDKKRDAAKSSLSTSESKNEKVKMERSKRSEAPATALKTEDKHVSGNLERNQEESKSIEPIASIQTAERLIAKKKFKEAISAIDLVIIKNTEQTETAIWLKAACFLQLNNIEEAKMLLQKLVDSKGKFASQAADILKKL